MAKTDVMFGVRMPGGSPSAMIKALTTTDGIAAEGTVNPFFDPAG